ncbi:MAG: HAD family hydrolase [Dehalococcoidia bacterium]|nr:HAD family hydrolase [Dehalococcoidia bacterium]
MPDLRNITTITFDMDDTLWDFQSAMKYALAITLQRLRSILPGDPTAGLTVQRMMDIRDGVALEMGEGTVRQEEIRYAAMVKTLELLGSADRVIADELFSIHMEARLAGAKPFDDVPDVLDALKNRYRLGIISNGNNTPQAVGLDDVFDFTVFAHDCGFPKPDPRIFEYALAIFGDEPQHVAHVGDSLPSDVQGANNHGMLSVWLNRATAANGTGIAPQREIRGLAELLDLFGMAGR